VRETINPAAFIKGRIRLFDVRKKFWTPKTPFVSNLVLYDWATVVGNLLTTGNNAYRINGMYLEFQNVTNPEEPVGVPSFTRYDGIEYYNNLANSSNSDYLRVPLVSSSLTSDDMTKWPNGNDCNFFAQTVASAGTGINGKPFNDTAISVVYGAALVVMPVQNDRTQDLVFSRAYLPAGEQQAKLATSQIGLQWSLDLQ